MQSYAEQFYLLSIDPVSGRSFPIKEKIFNLTLAGALLFDASFNNLINDDWEKISILKTDETGNDVLDEAMRCLLIFEGAVPLEKPISLVASYGETLTRLIKDQLINQGLLVKSRKNKISISSKLAYFKPNMPGVIAIQKEIRNTVINEDIPDFQMPPLVSLMVAAGLTKYIFTADEAKKYADKISWLSRMESLGREIIRLVNALQSKDLEKSVAGMIGLNHDQPKAYAGGMDAVLSSLSHLYKETGMSKSRKLIGKMNQFDGFECPGCAWPNPDDCRSRFEFCENGAKSVSAEATNKVINADFFKQWSVPDLLLTSDYWLEQQGRLGEPMLLEEGTDHYKPVSWKDAYQLIADELNALDHPNEAVFYASGKISNEAAFLYQLMARAYGTNNLPNSANICHEPSGKALAMSLGFGKSSVILDDFPQADAIFVFGHNPGSNHPRMLSSLQAAVRNGSKIVAINPMPEASLMGFADPQEIASYFGEQTALTRLYLQPRINGDMALVRGIVKTILEKENTEGGILDTEFINQYTSGFENYCQLVEDTTWEEIIQACGVSKEQIEEAAAIYMASNKVITCWCLGITHHLNSIETIREIINLQLLKGNIGKAGAGVCPVRGHSNIQGIRTSGSGENMPLPFLEALEEEFNIKVPRKPGLSAVPAIKAMAEKKVKVLLSLGGNLASAAPDTAFTADALQNCNLTVMVSTKLNKSHLVTGKKALILPALSRTEQDIRNKQKQFITVEDAMAKVGISQGCLPPCSTNIKSDVSIVSEMAETVLGKSNKINWKLLGTDNQHIRNSMDKVISAFWEIDKLKSTDQGFYLDNPLRKRVFKTDDERAHFSNYKLDYTQAMADELLLMTIRSHDQFNTSIFGLNDRYRGITNERRVLFMNSEDMKQRNIAPEQLVELSTHYDNKSRSLAGYYAIPYPIQKGCVAAYFPETNVLTSINNTHKVCHTPAFKSVRVLVG